MILSISIGLKYAQKPDNFVLNKKGFEQYYGKWLKSWSNNQTELHEFMRGKATVALQKKLN